MLQLTLDQVQAMYRQLERDSARHQATANRIREEIANPVSTDSSKLALLLELFADMHERQAAEMRDRMADLKPAMSNILIATPSPGRVQS